MSVFDDILKAKQKEVASMQEAADIQPCKRRSFIGSLRSGQFAFIAEIKPKSPSSGELLSRSDIKEMLGLYEEFANAISVLCDEKFFGGGYNLLSQISGQTEKPLLAKEFVISGRQIEEAVINGASAVLLIAAIVSEDLLENLIRRAIDLNCDVLLELHSDGDLEKASAVFRKLSEEERLRIVFGINNRDLDSLEISLETTKKLAPKIRSMIGNQNLLISESGILSADDARELSEFVDGFLIGTSILKSNDPRSFLSSLKTACGQK